MTVNFRSHYDFLTGLDDALSRLPKLTEDTDQAALFKVRHMNLDFSFEILKPLYSPAGRFALNQIEILRSLILMVHYRETSIVNWTRKTKQNACIAALCGFHHGTPPSASSYYDFLNRIGAHCDSGRISLEGRFSKKNKPKLKKNEKYVPEEKESVQDVINRLESTQNPLYKDRCRFIKRMFAGFVKQSDKFLKLEKTELIINGDGTAEHTFANPNGHHLKNTAKNRNRIPSSLANTDWQQLRSYSEPDAVYCWDSDKALWYLGYNCYFLTEHARLSNGEMTDLPRMIHIPRNPAQHDSKSFVESLFQYIALHDERKISCVNLDSAHDNSSTYFLLDSYGIEACIDRNKRRSDEKDEAKRPAMNQDGNPVCPAGQVMTFVKESGNKRIYICPKAAEKLSQRKISEICGGCDRRRVEINITEFARSLPKMVYQSDAWKLMYNNRTSSERLNNRVLNDYCVQEYRGHGVNRRFFMNTAAAINIHLDAWYKSNN